MKRLNMSFFSILLGCFLILGSIPALAQETDSTEFTLEEITVTAEKRVENLQKTAISMAVIQGEELRETGAVSIADILKDIPNVSTSDTGGMGSTINIRGLGQDMPIGVGDSSVSTNFDGAYQMRSEANMFGYFDVQRVEVLRGPQGTLYGRNATGGVVNIVSAKPQTDKVEGYAALEVADYKKMKTEAAINVPVTEKFAGRLAFVTAKENGYTHDSQGGVDSQEGLATRIQLRYVPSDDSYINLLYSFTQRTGRMGGEVSKPNWDAGNYDLNNYTYPYNRTYRSKTIDSKIALTAEFPLGVGVVTVLPTYETIKNRTSNYSPPQGPGIPPNSPAQLNLSGNPWDNVTKTAEMRYASKADSDVKWVGGLYYSETDEPRVPRRAPYTTNPGADSYKWYKTEAAFAQATYPVSDTFRLILGARYDVDKKGYFDDRFPDLDVPAPAKNSFSFSYFDWKVGVEKDFAKELMGYVTLSSGHKAGGFSEDDGTPFDTESAISGEIGLKSRFMDNRLQVNGDIFYYDYKGYQVVDVAWVVNEDYPEGTVKANFFNADKAKNYGAEIETTALVGDATELNLNFAYLKNEYMSDFFVHADPFGPALNMKGKTMPHSPEFTVKAGISHTFFFSDDSTLKPSISYRWTDEQYYGVLISDDTLGPAYSIADISINYSSNKNWSLNLYSNNAFNEHYYTGSVQQRTLVYFPGNPRTTGLTLNLKF